ncbi:MAG TPA: hypothetical protein VFI46_00820 [Jiangellaceae bacterium]|nr:hypothetical protein [Jiangellaceae bacterium]
MTAIGTPLVSVGDDEILGRASFDAWTYPPRLTTAKGALRQVLTAVES